MPHMAVSYTHLDVYKRQILGGILGMMGHNWSVFLGFKGGRGVATGLGVLIALSPIVALICFLVWRCV